MPPLPHQPIIIISIAAAGALSCRAVLTQPHWLVELKVGTLSQGEGRMQGLSKGIQVLESLAADANGTGVREVSLALDIPKSVVGRILKTLLETGLAAQDPVSRRYTLGPKAAALGHSYASRVDFVQFSRPAMMQLRELTNETISLNVRFGWMRVCVAQVESLEELRAAGEIGRAYPLDTGAPGRILLSAMSDAEIRHVLQNRESLCTYASHQRLRKRELLRSLDAIRLQGFTVADQETMRGVCSVAVPVRNEQNVVVAALGLLAPHDRFRLVNLQHLVGLVKDAALSIEKNLGRAEQSPSSVGSARSFQQTRDRKRGTGTWRG